jgi:hypothetical protein
MNQLHDLPIYDLHVFPTYAVCLKQRPPRVAYDPATGEVIPGVDPQTGEQLQPVKTEAQKRNEENLRKNQRAAGLSVKASRRLINAVNWLVASAKQKTIFDKSTGKSYTFKVNFVTLTLPATTHEISDHFFKSVLLHNFINTCRASHSMRNFVWKVEAQKNGNIHAHFTTDTFIHWRALRTVWNNILRKHGVIDAYTEKHSAMSFDDYIGEYSEIYGNDLNRARKAYDAGVSSGWSDPNTTDVHAVWKVDDIAGYLSKYMGKNETDRREIKGRLWSCSYGLSSKNKLTIEICGSDDGDVLAPLHDDRIAWKPIQIASKIGSSFTTIGDIFFFRLSDWGTVLTGRLLSYFNDFRYKIREDLHRLQRDIFQVDNVPPEFVSDPVPVVSVVARTPHFYGKQVSFNF